MNSKIAPTRKGLRLDAPEPGDIVTVKVKRQPKRETPAIPFGAEVMFGRTTDEADNPQHYRMTGLWRVIAVNGGQAVVEGLEGYVDGRREIWPISLHEWFEASELYEAMQGAKKP